MTALKILHVISNLSPRSGGPTTVVRSLSAYQASAGLDITVCTTAWGYTVSEKRALDTLVKKNRTSYRFFSTTSPLALSPAIFKWLGGHLKQFDIMHIHGLYRFPVTAAAWWARRHKVPYIIMPHGSLDPFLYKQSRYNLLLKRIYERLFEIPNLNNAAAVHYTVEEEAKRAGFLKIKAKKVILPCGIDLESYRRLPVRGRFRRKIKISKDTPLTLFLGRVNFKKGLDILVSAFVHVVNKIPDARLAIVGPDNEGYCSKVQEWCIQKCIQDKVFFLDYLQHERSKEAFVDADVFVLPSYSENFGLTVIEAMACGCPVVISDRVNIWREIQAAGAGTVVKLNPSELADAICRVLLDKELAKNMGVQGRKAAETYAWPPIVEKLTEIYRELINENRSSNHFQRRYS